MRKHYCAIDGNQYEVKKSQAWQDTTIFLVRQLLGTEQGYIMRVKKEDWRVLNRRSGLPEIKRRKRICHAVCDLLAARA